MPKKLAHHKRRPRVKGPSFNVFSDHKSLECPGTCDEHKGPRIHYIRFGQCEPDSPVEQHYRCKGFISKNMGGKKPVACDCSCHLLGEVTD